MTRTLNRARDCVARAALKHPSRRSPARAALALLACAGLSALSGCGIAAQGRNTEGVRLFQQGNYQAALEKFQTALSSDPQNADAYYNLGATYHRLAKATGNKADFNQAEMYYNQALDQDADHREAYRGLAVMLVEEERSNDAFKLLEGWANRNPSDPVPRIELARIHEEFGNREAAREHLISAVSLDPYNAQALAALGRVHELLGNHAQALADYERSLWQDRLQPEVAARVAALRGAFGQQMLTAPDGTRTVNAAPPVTR